MDCAGVGRSNVAIHANLEFYEEGHDTVGFNGSVLAGDKRERRYDDF